MLDDDRLAEIEGDAAALYSMAREDPDDPPGLPVLCRRLIGSAPRRVRMVGEARCLFVLGAWRLEVHRLLPPHRMNFLIGHELAEWWATTQHLRFGSLAEREAYCDALGARLACPRPAFSRAVRSSGHRVHALARAFIVPQGLALLRIGEVTGRPVVFHRSTPIARGEPFVWPTVHDACRRRDGVHPVRVDGLWGLMATR